MHAGLGTFVGVSALVIMTPGQDTALVVRNTLAGGRRGGLFTTFGVVAGQLTWTLASVVGLTALLIASGPLFAAVRFAGAAYLMGLGLHSLRHALARRESSPAPAALRPRECLAPRAALSQGFLSALGNAKLAVFFVSLFPQFIPQDRPGSAAIFGLGLLFCAMTLLWLSGYAIVVERVGDLFGRPRARRAAEGVLGAALIAVGLRVALERR